MTDTDIGLIVITLVSWTMIAATFYFADRRSKKMLDTKK